MSIFAEIVLGEKLQEMTRRAETAEAALAAKRADAIQHHAEMIGEFADMVNQRDAAIARAETAEDALAECDKARVMALDRMRWIAQDKEWAVDVALTEAQICTLGHDMVMEQLAESNFGRDTAIARAETAEAALDDMIAQRDGALATAGIAEARVEILRARAETAEAALAEAQAELQASETLLDMERWQAGWKTRSEAAEDALAQCQHDLTEMIERKEYFRQCWEVAEAALAERDKPCVWCEEKEKVYGMVFWGSSCGAAYRTADMVEPGKFCLHCGHPIELQP